MKFFISRKYLKALEITAAQQDIRDYLISIHFIATKKATYAVSTDGHRMGIVNFTVDNEFLDCERLELTVPLNAIKAIKHQVKRADDLIVIEKAGEHWLVNDIILNVASGFRPIEDRFPDVQRVVPKETSGEVAQFNAEYIGDFAKISKVLCLKYPHPVISHNGNAAALVEFEGESSWFGVVMPARCAGASRIAPLKMFPPEVPASCKAA